MSFVDLMANDVWSEADINNNVQALIRSHYTQEDELKAARLSRKSDASEEEKTFVDEVDAVIVAAIQAGRDARADMDLLMQVFPLEVAQRRLAQYRLADGKPAESTGLQQIDADGNPVWVMNGSMDGPCAPAGQFSRRIASRGCR